MKRFLYLGIMAMVLGIFSVSCAEDVLNGERYNSQVIINGNKKFTHFIIPYTWKDIDERVEGLNINLVGLQSKLGVHDFPAVVTLIGSDSCEVKLDMSVNREIPDGKYAMQLKHGEWHSRETFIVQFKNDYLCMISVSDDPYAKLYNDSIGAYEIANSADFDEFLKGLSKDSYNASGKLFKQTADIDWSDMKSSIGYGMEHRQHFAGTYDGGFHTINNLSFSGASSNDNVDVGLFRTLKNGAEIRKLKLVTSSGSGYTGIKERGGVLAGSASGTVGIKYVEVTGTIAGNGSNTSYNVGGLIGYAKDANITIEHVNLNIAIYNAYKHIGGLIGWLENSNLKVSDVSTPNYEINIYGDEYVGGFVGVVKNSAFNISWSALNHAGSANTPNYFLIQVKNGKAGGVIGSIESLSSTSSMTMVDVRVPVGAARSVTSATEVGGLIGYASLNMPLIIADCFVGAKIEGSKNVGGFIGEARLYTQNAASVEFTGLNVISPQKKSNVEIVGHDNVGGFIGLVDGKNKDRENNRVAFEGDTRLVTNVTGYGECTGGMIGKFINGKIVLTNEAETRIDSMSVITNKGKYVGGMVGYMDQVNVDAQNNFDFNGSIPKFSSFKPNVCSTINGNEYTGGAFGYVYYCAIDGVCVKGTVTGAGEYTGGVFGFTHFNNDAKIQDCTFDGIVTGNANNTGGISGYCKNNGRFQDCINYGQVEGTDNVGGIVGKVDYFEKPPYIYYCVNVGNVTGKGDVGGVVGFMDGQQDCSSWTKIQRCGNYGEVYLSGNKENCAAGGILGRCKQRHVEVINCANHGYIHGSAERVAGIAGWIGRDPSSMVVWYQSNNVHVRYCANFGNIASTNGDAYIGGICGWQEEGYEGDYSHSHLQACYNCGEILSDPSYDTGGLLGCADTYTATEDCINYGKVHHGNVAVGTRNGASIIDVVDIYYLEGTGATWRVDESNKFTKSDLTNKNKFSGLNWSDHWTIGNSVYSSVLGGQHPVLKDCPFQNIKWN